MNILTQGNAVTLQSSVYMGEIELLKKYAPNKLKLKSEDGKEDLLAFDVGTEAVISKYGICFTNEDADGFAILTKLIPTNCVDKNDYIVDMLLPIMDNCTNLENQIMTTAQEICEAKENLLAKIQ